MVRLLADRFSAYPTGDLDRLRDDRAIRLLGLMANLGLGLEGQGS